MPFTHTIKFHHNADRCQTPSAGARTGGNLVHAAACNKAK